MTAGVGSDVQGIPDVRLAKSCSCTRDRRNDGFTLGSLTEATRWARDRWAGSIGLNQRLHTIFTALSRNCIQPSVIGIEAGQVARPPLGRPIDENDHDWVPACASAALQSSVACITLRQTGVSWRGTTACATGARRSHPGSTSPTRRIPATNKGKRYTTSPRPLADISRATPPLPIRPRPTSPIASCARRFLRTC